MNLYLLLWKSRLFQWDPLFKERICSYRSKFFPRRGDPLRREAKKGKIIELLHLKVYLFRLPYLFNYKTGFPLSRMTTLVGWLFWVYRPFETVFQSISGCLPEREKEKRKDRWRKNVQTTPVHTYCKHNRPLAYYYPN